MRTLFIASLFNSAPNLHKILKSFTQKFDGLVVVFAPALERALTHFKSIPDVTHKNDVTEGGTQSPHRQSTLH